VGTLQTLLTELRCRGGLVNGAQQLPVIFKRFGFKRGLKYLYRWLKRNDYQTWLRQYDPLNEQHLAECRQQISTWPTTPKISVLMVLEDDPGALVAESIQSIQAQCYEHWELIVVHYATDIPPMQLGAQSTGQDPRVQWVRQAAPADLAGSLNLVLDRATGDYVTVLEPADLLSPQALFHIARIAQAHPDAAMIDADQDKITAQGVRYDPWFQPALNFELLLTQNRIGHLVVYRRDLINILGSFRPGYEGAERYELALRVIECIAPQQAHHIPKVLYHQRRYFGNSLRGHKIDDAVTLAGRRAVNDHLIRSGRGGWVSPSPEMPAGNRIHYPMPDNQPRVSIIIPTRDKAELLGLCLDSLLDKSTYPNYEIIIVDNGSIETATQTLFKRLPADRVRILRDDAPFNYSRLNNRAVSQAQGDVICLMNNDIEILTPDWMEEMLSFACQPDIGCVGARLWFPDGRLQHAGVIAGLGGVAGHPNKYFPRGHPGYFGRAVLAQRFSAVTAACLMVRRDIWEKVQGLDETLAVAFNDVDFCLRVQAAGYRNVWTPHAEMNHHESASRGNENTPAQQARYDAEIALMHQRWGEVLMHDPAYNPNLTLQHDDFSLAWPPRS